MTKYGLTLINNSGKGRRFFFFTEQPAVDGASDDQIFVNTWLSVYADDGEPVNVSTVLDFYAWCGPSTQNKGTTTISQGVPSKTPVTLGTKDKKGSAYKTKWDPQNRHFGWGDKMDDAADAGAYLVQTDTFTPQDNLNIGLAMKKNGASYPTPVAVVPADPNTKYNISPIVKFYVATGERKENEVFKIKAESATAGCYDFVTGGEGKGYTHGTISYNDKGEWEPTEYDNNTILSVDGDGPDGEVNRDLVAVVEFTKPVKNAAVRSSTNLSIEQQLRQISYDVNKISFSPDGRLIHISVTPPRIQSQPPGQIIIPPRPYKPASQVEVELDARNELLKITFTPQILPFLGVGDNIDPGVIAKLEGTSLDDDNGLPREFNAAVDKGILNVVPLLPSEEEWTIQKAW